MVVDDFHGLWAGVGPLETNPILLVDPDTVLAASVALQCFEPVPGRNPQIFESFDRVQLLEFAYCNTQTAKEGAMLYAA